MFTTSYGGGTNLDGSITAAGGFDPILSLFDASGNFIDANDDGPNAATDNNTGSAFDAGLQETLAAGTYQVVVTEFDNFSNADPESSGYLGGTSLADGFYEAGKGNFTGNDFGTPDQAGLGFIDADGNQRTSSFTLDIGNGPLAPVPEASTTVSFGLLLMLGLGGVAIRTRRKAQAE